MDGGNKNPNWSAMLDVVHSDVGDYQRGPVRDEPPTPVSGHGRAFRPLRMQTFSSIWPSPSLGRTEEAGQIPSPINTEPSQSLGRAGAVGGREGEAVARGISVRRPLLPMIVAPVDEEKAGNATQFVFWEGPGGTFSEAGTVSQIQTLGATEAEPVLNWQQGKFHDSDRLLLPRPVSLGQIFPPVSHCQLGQQGEELMIVNTLRSETRL